ncbi:MAG: glutathione S-transferase family protein [Hyphomicrobium sp.]|uniref:glutathione S-transferase family protein n=1 Tax=Hyphomicrobium sp. TaxID=82 RepID=UPI00132C7AFD|nr:glutathione S-transferase family protein [Hyphomicrobium sp.]KAB2941778.1 MAG: glutathione S-transferase family protein [Hyphomicrobium sp.]MBZ0210051.1 glutathione S-transferase family protein [Hyphomicrobium sp.]
MPEAAQPRLKLYHATPSRSSVAMWMLEEIGEPYEVKLLSLKDGDQRKPEYLAINPMGKVPTLDDGGTIVSEVSAICCYLADAYPKAGLAPPIGDKLRGPYLKWLFYAPSCIEPAMIDKALSRPPAPRTMAGWADYDTVIATLREATAKASPHLLGERFSAADVVIGSSLRWGMQFKLLPELPEFVAYTQRLAARPALQRQISNDEAFARQMRG